MQLSDNDANSTQLEGKKLKGYGVAEGYRRGTRHLEIEEESPALFDGEPEQEQEIGEPDNRETKRERDERLKREQLAVRQQQQNLQKQQTQQQQVEHKNDPNLHLDEIEQGVVLSRMKGKPINKQAFKQAPQIAEHHSQHQESHSSIPLVGTLIGGAVKMAESIGEVIIADKDKPPPGSVAATKVDDIRHKEGVSLSV